MDHHIGAINSALGSLYVTNDDTTSTYSNSPNAPTDHTQRSRTSSRASSISQNPNHLLVANATTTDRPRSRNDTRSSQVSAQRGKLPDAADPEYSYVYVPPLSSLHGNAAGDKSDVERGSIRSEKSGRSANSRNVYVDAPTPPSTAGRSRNIGMSNENNPSVRNLGQDRNGRLRDRTRSEEWAERGSAVVVQETRNQNGETTEQVIKKGVKDFQFGRTLGEGSYSTVVAATDRSTLREYAIKMLDKKHIIKEKKVKYVNIEKNTLSRLGNHPGIVKLYFTFQDETTLYFALDLATNGELLGYIKKVTSL